MWPAATATRWGAAGIVDGTGRSAGAGSLVTDSSVICLLVIWTLHIVFRRCGTRPAHVAREVALQPELAAGARVLVQEIGLGKLH